MLTLSPPPGLNSDDSTFSVPEAWADSNGCRFRLGKPEAIGVSSTELTLPNAGTDGSCRSIFCFDRNGTVMVAYGRVESLYIGSGLAAPSDRTPVGFTAASAGWCFAAWGSTLLACPSFGATEDSGGSNSRGPLYEQSGSGVATEVTEAPDQINYMLVTQQRQVMALGCNEVGGTFNGRCIRVSDLEDYSSAGSWTPTSTNNSDEIVLDGPGDIVAGANLGAFVIVWTTAGLYWGQYIGDPGQTYRFDRVAENCGLLGVQAFTVVDQTAYWLGIDLQFRRWTPGGAVEIIECSIWRDFIDNFNPSNMRDRLIMGADTRQQEIWTFYVDTRDNPNGENSRYLTFNYITGDWFRGQFGRTAWHAGGLAKLAISSGGNSVLTATSASVIHKHDAINVGFEAGYIQTSDFYLDKSQRRMMIRGIVPDFDDQDVDVSLTLYVRDRPKSSATTKGPYTITTAATKKDFRASGKIVAAKFSWEAGTGAVRFGTPLFDVVPLGER